MDEVLSDGLVLRDATDHDVPAIEALSVGAFGEREGVRSVLDDPGRGVGVFSVVTDAGRVVSSLCLLDETLRLSGVEVPCGQIEFVATDPEYRRRGLVRAQFERMHRWSADRGELLTLVTGIPYFYRRLGYEYALGLPEPFVPGWGAEMAMPGGWAVRAAKPDDLAELQRLHSAMQAASELAWVRTPRVWRLLLSGQGEGDIWVGVRGGHVEASARLWTSEGLHWMLDLAAYGLDGGRALLAAALQRLPAGTVAIFDRPGTPPSALLTDLGVPFERRVGIYARVPDAVRLLDHLRPLLSRRLAASPFGDDRGSLTIACYASGFALDYEAGQVTAVRAEPGVEEPGPSEVGVPPDLLATLILGRYGARGLAHRHDDVQLGRHAALMEVLFPRLRTDLQL
jgi:predicted N-acetyltransferase YhbS